MLQIKKPTDGILRTHLRLAISGVPASGKTMSSLLMACGLTNYGRVLLLDSENGRAIRKIYNNEFLGLTGGWQPDIVEPPNGESWDYDIYLEALNQAVDGGYDLIIFDSVSVGWNKVLEKHKDGDSTGKNRNAYVRWDFAKEKYDLFTDKLLHAPIHSISTVLTKKVPEGKGFRDYKGFGIKYIWGVDYIRLLDFLIELVDEKTHTAEVLRSDFPAYPLGACFQPSIESGQKLHEYLSQLKDGSFLANTKTKYIDRIHRLILDSKEKSHAIMDGKSLEDFLQSLQDLSIQELLALGKKLKSL